MLLAWTDNNDYIYVVHRVILLSILAENMITLFIY